MSSVPGKSDNVQQEAGKPKELQLGLAFAEAVARALADLKAEAVAVLDVRGLTDVTDFMVLATAMRDRHLGALADVVESTVRDLKRTRLGTEGSPDSGWMLVDTGDVVAHVFSASSRQYYDLDRLWGDAKIVEGEE